MDPRTAPGFTGQRSGVKTTLLLTAGLQAEPAPAHTPGVAWGRTESGRTKAKTEAAGKLL